MIHRDQLRRTAAVRLFAILIALLVSLTITDAARAGSIWIEWDRSPDPSVIGYRVSVGTSPGVYTQTFDVGSATSFVYQASESRLYYLAVASYAAGPVVGPLSSPISATPSDTPAGGGPSDASSFYEAIWRSGAAAASAARSVSSTAAASRGVRALASAGGPSLPSAVCWDSSAECLTVRTVIRRSAAIGSLAVSSDDRLFFIEDMQQVRVIASQVLQPRPVLAASAAVQLSQLILDPAFALTGVMYVGETATQAEGTREFRVVRYRVVRSQAAERVVLFSLPLPSTGQALFSVSSSGQLYVAIPSAGGLQASPYAGMVLRVDIDETVAFDQSGRTLAIATGYPTPTAITFDEYWQRLWLAGLDEVDQPSIVSPGGGVVPASAAVTSLSVATDRAAGGRLFLASASGALGTAQVARDGTINSISHLMIGTGSVRSVAAAPTGDVFVAVATESAAGETTSILRLIPAR